MERAARVALSGVSGLGPARFRRLLEEFGSAVAALEAGPAEMQARAGLATSLIEELVGLPVRLEEVEAEIAALDEQGVRALTWEDADYPQLLLPISSAPPVLWWSGEVGPNDGPAVAVVGSREVSDEALIWAREAAARLAEGGVVVVSGLAAGVDAAAHEGALSVGGPTVGVCGCGILTALTRGTGGLAGQVAEGGALCSELSPAAPLLPQALHARDRITAGLASAVIIVEARAEGGAVHTAKCALREGRPVFAVASQDRRRAPGNAQLLAEGARPLITPQDALAVVRGSSHV